MSTFGGVMDEFPDIRVDYFRQIKLVRPPLACFLSHIHSDHLTGLESLKAPFVYCSPATKELLLRLEKYYHRLNFAAGVLEAHKQQYKHLKNLLKPIPLETPTRIELGPGNEIQVTLFDANHCTGAVMFLIEGKGKAVLYTGDIRSEPWFVNSLIRNPHMIEYSTGLKRLDCIYLDTSNVDAIPFPTKAEGLKELLTKVASYPPETTFHFSAWTFGYEEVYMALSRALKSQIHVDDYKFNLYKSLRGDPNSATGHLAVEGPALSGFMCGNTPQPGCLTRDKDVRIHSCEKGMMCPTVTENPNVVWIQPIITRTKSGAEIAEVGIGGGWGDLNQGSELELGNMFMVEELLDIMMALFESRDEATHAEVKEKLLAGLRSKDKSVSLNDMGFNFDDEISLTELTKAFARAATKKHEEDVKEDVVIGGSAQERILPRLITFPYSRHSSYEELCHLVNALNPKDIYPCTVDEENWHPGISMKTLFGHECTATVYRHDMKMEHLYSAAQSKPGNSSQVSQVQQTQTTTYSEHSQPMLPPNTPDRAGSLQTPHTSDQKGKAIQVDITAVSPSSASQNRRRKIIMDGFEQSSVKRPRFGCAEGNQPVPGSWPMTDDIASNAWSPSPSPSHEYDQSIEFYDYRDKVFRCKECGHEKWSIFGSCTCTGCDFHDTEPTYLERIHIGDDLDEAEPWPKKVDVVPNSFESDFEEDPANARTEYMLNHEYLDYQSSAYDSQDSSDALEEYEMNSFIDDSSVKDEEPNSSSSDGENDSSDGETDYKEKFKTISAALSTLVTEHSTLLANHEDLQIDYKDFKRDVLGSDYNSSEGEIDEDDTTLINPQVPDPAITEIILSQSQEDSQVSRFSEVSEVSEISEGRVMEAFQAANDDEWHNITLASTGNNHTHVEMEL